MSKTAVKHKPEPFKPDMSFMKAVAEAMSDDPGYLFVDPAFLHGYAMAGLVESNASITDAAGSVATKLTAEGMEYVGAEAPTANATVSEDSDFEFDNVEIPTSRGRGRGVGGTKYKFFEALPAPIAGKPPFSHHLPLEGSDASDPKELAKNFASNVSAANARYSKETGRTERVKVSTYKLGADGRRVKENGHYVKIGEDIVDKPVLERTREFQIRPVDAKDPKGPGVRIFRVK